MKQLEKLNYKNNADEEITNLPDKLYVYQDNGFSNIKQYTAVFKPNEIL